MVESSARPKGTGGHGLQAFQPAGSAPANARTSRAHADGNHNSGASDENRAKDGKAVGTSGNSEKGDSNDESDEGGDKEDVEDGLIGASAADHADKLAAPNDDASLEELLSLVGADARKDVRDWIDRKLGGSANLARGGMTATQTTATSAPASVAPRAFNNIALPQIPATVAPPAKSANPAVAAPVATSTPKISMTHSGEFFTNSVDTPEALVTLLLNRHHLPLTLCTTAAVNDIATNPAAVRYTKVHDRWSVKRELIDTSNWPSETSMSKEDWLDAYRNFDVVLREAADADVGKLFKDHFDFLCGRPEFRDSFPVILKFDIEVRRRFFVGSWKKFDVGSVGYCQRINDVSLEVLRQEVTKANTSRGHQSYSSKRPADSTTDAASSRSDSFRPFRNDTDTTEDSLCLICGCRGHTAGNCTRQTTVIGRPVFSAWRDKRLVTLSGKKALCIYWNLRGRPCRPQAPRCPGAAGHICSLCGATDHHAGAKRCRREG